MYPPGVVTGQFLNPSPIQPERAARRTSTKSAGPESCIYETGKAIWPVVDLTEIGFRQKELSRPKKGARPESCTIIELEGHISLCWS